MPHTRWEDIYPPLGSFKHIGDAAVEAWDYAAALAADIPELAVFSNGFNGKGMQVWETFDCGYHPGFTLLRFLGMSSEYGKCDRWFVGDAKLEDGLAAAKQMLDTCTDQEVKAIVQTMTKYAK